MSFRAKTIHYLRLVFFVSCFAFPASVFAATLSIDPSAGKFGPGDTFILTVRLDTDPGECVNAASVDLHYPTDWMKAVAVSNGESLFTLWPEAPQVDLAQGIIQFAGGIPGGYCGRIQGDPERTNVLVKVIFSIPGNMIGGKVATGPLPLPITFGAETRVLLNDGQGTVAPLLLRSGAYTRELVSLGAKNEWLDIVHGDTTPPDPFIVTREQDKNTFQGKYFIVFAAVDKQSGVHHYEVSEDDPVRLGYTRGKASEQALFVAATSPYVLRDQTLGSRVIVRALDHAGNVAEAILPPKDVLSVRSALADEGSENTLTLWSLVGVSVFLVLGFLGWLFYRRRKGGYTEAV
jgi:hypothetical protein